MSLLTELKDYMVGQNLVDNPEKITISRIPNIQLKNDQWALVRNGGTVSGGNILQWKRTHNLIMLYRNKSGEQLDNADDILQEVLAGCVSLPSYKLCRKPTVEPGSELPNQPKEVHIMQWNVRVDIIKRESEES